MNTVRFTSANKDEKQFVATLRKNVNDYFKENNISTKANTAMVFKTIALISLYLVPYILILVIPMSPWLALGLSILIGVGIAGVGMGVMHDACHGAYSKKHWVNNLLSGTLYLLGSNVLNWKIQHNVLHHTYTNISGLDEDINTKGPIRLAEQAPLKWYHRYQFLYAFVFYGLMTITMLTNDFSRLFQYEKAGLVKSQNKNVRSEYLKMLFRKVVYLSLVLGLPMWLTDFNWYQILLGFFVMHWVASIILSFVFQMAHVVEGAEQPVVENELHTDWHVHQLKTTSDFARNSKLLSWYVGGLNFQIEHHLFPNICHIHYPKLAPIVERTAQEFGIPYNLKSSFGSALMSHVERLKELGESLIYMLKNQFIRVTKKFTFDMAHALYAYDGPCKNIHGHTYVLYVTLKGKALEMENHPKNGMVIDFTDFKKIVNEQVVSVFDHSLVLNLNSPHSQLKELNANFEKINYVPYQPSCENLIIDFLNRINLKLPSNVTINTLKLEETPTSYAEWFLDDNSF